MSPPVIVGAVAEFNLLEVEQAVRKLLPCCASDRWAREVVAARPYPEVNSLLAMADAALRRLSWADISQALTAHPRIGERPAGTDAESAWSRREQAGVDHADARIRAALAAANRAYEARFEHIFLIFASGKTDAEILAAATTRLANDALTEREVVRVELANIVRLRVERLFT